MINASSVDLRRLIVSPANANLDKEMDSLTKLLRLPSTLAILDGSLLCFAASA